MTDVNGVRVPLPEPISFNDNALLNIRYFRHQWRYYCIATGLDRMSNEKKVATFFLYLGREAFTYISNNLELSDDEMNDCDKILTALENGHKSNSDVINRRFLFNQAVQEDNETIDDFLIKLKKLSEHCDFRGGKEEMIRDRFVSGLRNKLFQKELLSESELCLLKAVRLCKQKESVNNSNHNENNAINSPNFSYHNSRRNGTIDLLNKSLPEFVPVREIKLARVKLERIDDDLMIVNNSDCDSDIEVTSSHGQFKRFRLDESKNSNSNEKSLQQAGQSETLEQTTEADYVDITVGSFVVLKDDWNTINDPPIWKVDTSALLQKFVPIEHNGIMLYKSTGAYSGWSLNVRDHYYRAPVIVRNKLLNGIETVVQFQKDLVPSENKIDKVNKITPKK